MTRIPLPQSPDQGFSQGLDQGSALFLRLLQPQIQQQQMQQQQAHHAENMNVRQMQQERLAQEFALKQALSQMGENRKASEFELKQREHPAKMSALEAKMKSEIARAHAIEKYGSQRPTAAIQEADALFDREDPQWNQYVLNKSKQYMPTEGQQREDEKLISSPEFEKIAPYLENAVDMNPLPIATQSLYRKQMNEELSQIDKAKQVKHAIGLARDITKNNPDLYKKAINIVSNPDSTPGFVEKSLTAILPKKDVEAFAGLAKLYADILTKQAQLNGMSRSVYALRLQQQAKAQVKNPDEVNEQIFKNIEHEIAPSLDREKALLYAMKHNQYLPYTKRYSLGDDSSNNVPNEAHAPTAMGMMKGVINGKEVDVDPSNEKDFISDGGRIL